MGSGNEAKGCGNVTLVKLALCCVEKGLGVIKSSNDNETGIQVARRGDKLGFWKIKTYFVLIQAQGFTCESVDEGNLIYGETETQLGVFGKVEELGKFGFTGDGMDAEGG